MNESDDKTALIDPVADAQIAVVESDSDADEVTVVEDDSEAPAAGEHADSRRPHLGDQDASSDHAADGSSDLDTDTDTSDDADADADADGDDDVPEADEVPEADAGAVDVAAAAGRTMVDPRGPRFGAAITVVVLAVALVTIPSITSVVLLVLQAIAFGAAALFGLKAQPYGWIYRSAVAPRLGPPSELEDEAPPRFAQQVGLGFVVIALFGLAIGIPLIAQVATAFALAAAFLNAAFNFCLGCEMYLMFHRLKARKTA